MVVPRAAPALVSDESVRDPAFPCANGCRSAGTERRFPKTGRLGAALQLGFLQIIGTTLAVMDCVPRTVLKHPGTQLQRLTPEIATLRALCRIEGTLYAHQSRAGTYAGYRWSDRVDTDAVIQTLEDGTAVTLDSHRLAQQAR
jgi:hypothetical protein